MHEKRLLTKNFPWWRKGAQKFSRPLAERGDFSGQVSWRERATMLIFLSYCEALCPKDGTECLKDRNFQSGLLTYP